MQIYLLPAAILLPLLAGLSLFLFKPQKIATLKIITMSTILMVSIFTWSAILLQPSQTLSFIPFAANLTFRLHFDALGRFFAGIIATLWPLTALYAFSYMEHETRLNTFFSFFTMAYGVTLGISMSANLFTLYCFYEMMTLLTVPLVIHTFTKKAVRAARVYLIFSLGGAAFAFASMIFLIANGASGDFIFGGLLHQYPYAKPYITEIFYVTGFLGFGVKAAVFPTHIWLPRASVAPTPVTALLHAVAVVKSGVFAIIRLTYFSFGTQLLQGTTAQTVVMSFAIFTIGFGAVKALNETHWKRRLAYSTVANLSYILFGVTMMTAEGLAAGLLHMAFHAEIKILAFFCAGAVLVKAGREYNVELEGLGKKMPITFGCFTVSALALVGIPPFSGFVSKWSLLTAAADYAQPIAYVGAGVLLFAALLTAMYMFFIVCRAFFPREGTVVPSDLHEADWRMCVPNLILAVGILLTGLFAEPIVAAATQIASGF